MKADRRWWNDGRLEREGEAWFEELRNRQRQSAAIVFGPNGRIGMRLFELGPLPRGPMQA